MGVNIPEAKGVMPFEIKSSLFSCPYTIAQAQWHLMDWKGNMAGRELADLFWNSTMFS